MQDASATVSDWFCNRERYPPIVVQLRAEAG